MGMFHRAFLTQNVERGILPAGPGQPANSAPVKGPGIVMTEPTPRDLASLSWEPPEAVPTSFANLRPGNAADRGSARRQLACLRQGQILIVIGRDEGDPLPSVSRRVAQAYRRASPTASLDRIGAESKRMIVVQAAT